MSWKMPPLQEIVLMYDKHEYAKKGKKMQTSGCGVRGAVPGGYLALVFVAFFLSFLVPFSLNSCT